MRAKYFAPKGRNGALLSFLNSLAFPKSKFLQLSNDIIFRSILPLKLLNFRRHFLLSVSPEIRLPKTFSALCFWKSNLNEITSDHANENYEVNMWDKYCRIYPELELHCASKVNKASPLKPI
jgi:hypothetical protein